MAKVGANRKGRGVNIIVVGSMGFDSIKTPEGTVENVLGGSANYFSMAASLYASVGVVGVVGQDYTSDHLAVLKKRGVDTQGIETKPGKTFHWTGEYKADMSDAITLSTELNVFQSFNPVVPQSYTDSHYVFLGNIDPELQLRVLDQVKSPQLVGCDTMNYWIKSKKEVLKQVLKRVHILFVNEGESHMLTGKANAIGACEDLLQMGPQAVVVKRGEYGFVFATKQGIFMLPAYPIAKVVDPTGAGDTFAGGFFGHLARVKAGFDVAHLKQACVHGCLLASFTVQDFGTLPLERLDWTMVERRHDEYRQMVSL
jgi:sugar/nucleoside kinase (ribokinase family)